MSSNHAIKFWIIVHKPTNDVMPEMKGGYTYWEPVKGEVGFISPRLFTTLRGAKCAARWWANGPVVEKVTQSRSSDIFGFDDEINTTFTGTPITGRSIDQLEIVEAHLSYIY